MGVKSLWSLLEPVARPTRLESLRNKRLAVDASIWLHQFMQAMKDGAGNPLPGAHILGFFRRICKLLFWNIKPVFVFDGGVPVLKRKTITPRTVRTAGGRRRDEVVTDNSMLGAYFEGPGTGSPAGRPLEVATAQSVSSSPAAPSNGAQAGPAGLGSSPEVLGSRKRFRAEDFELPPDDETRLAKLQRGDAVKDARLVSQNELRGFIRQHRDQLDGMDVDSSYFNSLPLEAQYELIQDMRIRSRSTQMDRIENMLAQTRTAMDFSLLQLKGLTRRNELTQKQAELVGGKTIVVKNRSMGRGEGSAYVPRRIIGERDREYVLIKNDETGIGWSFKVKEVSRAEPGSTETQTVIKIKDEEEEMGFANGHGGFESGMERHPTLIDLDDEDVRLLASDSDENEEFVEVEPEVELPRAARKPAPQSTDIGRFRAANRSPAAKRSLFPTEVPEETSEQDEDEVTITRFKLKRNVGKEMLRILSLPPGVEGDEEVSDALSTARRKLGKMKEEDVGTPKGECLQWWCTFLDAAEEFRAHLPPSSTEVVTLDDEPERPPPVARVRGAVRGAAVETAELVDDSSEPEEEVTVVASRRTATGSNAPLKVPVPPADVSLRLDDVTPMVVVDEDEKDEEVEALPPVLSSIATARPASPAESVESVRRAEETRAADLPSPASPQPAASASPARSAAEEAPEMPAADAEEDEEDWEDEAEEEQPPDYAEAEAQEEAQPEPVRNDVETNMDAEMAEYARFVADLARKDELDVRRELEREVRSIKEQRGRDERLSQTVTNAMIAESQELLRLFGLPFIVAPLEAEAQCAKLMQLGLVDGIVTDDSDVFLFGGKLVYRNLFSQTKFVECYVAGDLEREMALDKQKLIRLAYLLGSDYTDGIKGVGGVTALEILDSFDSGNAGGDGLGGLREFSKFWWRAKMNQLTDADKSSALKKRLANLCLKVELPDSFPAPEVRNAYMNPTVDDSTEPFEWGVPSLDQLRDFLDRKLGWTHDKTDEVVLPIIRQIGSYETEGVQQTIDRFF
ncbi:hypothetical protein DFJ74DRAFT_592101, partial [Hyaloraphidium curvatum]